MIDAERAFDIENGLQIDGGPFITGGPLSPSGLDLPVDTIYIQNEASAGITIWKKYGALNTEWRPYSAEDIRALDTSESPSLESDIQSLLSNLLSGNTPSVSQTLYFGDGGNTAQNSYLSNNGVKSNLVGVPVGLTNPKIRSVFLGNKNTRTGNVLIQERFPAGAGTWITVYTIPLANQSYVNISGLSVALTKDAEIAAFTEVSLKSVKVVLNVNGEST